MTNMRKDFEKQNLNQNILKEMVEKVYFVGLTFKTEIKNFDRISIKDGIAKIYKGKKELLVNKIRLKIIFKTA